MRKTTILLVSLLLLCSFSGLSFAQKVQGKSAKKAESSIEVIRGKIVSIDTTKNEVVIRNEKTGIEKTVSVSPTIISSLKTDEQAKVTLKSGTNTAESVKKIVPKKTSTKKQN